MKTLFASYYYFLRNFYLMKYMIYILIRIYNNKNILEASYEH